MNTAKLAFENPATGERFGEVAMTSPDAVKQAVEDMRAAFPTWSGKPVRERIRILRKLQTILIDQRDEISAVVNQDCGKSRQDGLIELFMAVDAFARYCSDAPKWLKRKRVSSGLYLFKRAYIRNKPYGVVAIISPWNYPLTLSLGPVLAALLAGNTVVLKPSEVAAATGVLIERLIGSVPELAECVRVVHGDGLVGAALTAAKPDFIFLTGSGATGKKVMLAASETLTPVALELGGKDAMIVLDDADIDQAARWGVWGACYNAGQTCMAVERVYVVESRYDEFVRLAVQYARDFKVGYTTDTDSPYAMGPITDPRQTRIIDQHLADALAKGARLLSGGKKDSRVYHPMVLVDVDHSMQLMQQESFGPFIPVMKVKDEDEAVRLANDSTFGLGAAVWSRNADHAWRIAERMEAGSVIINDALSQYAIPMLPFGGVKESGFGRTHGQEGFMQFTRPHSYAVGGSPSPLDIATMLRQTGRYNLAVAILGIVYGTSWRQRWEALAQLLRKPGTREEMPTAQPALSAD